MKLRFFLLTASALLISTFLSFSQYDLSSFPPPDPEIRTGKLPNGLTYYIKSNREPQKRVSFYFIQNVGALLEDDNEDGLAHFLEHMAFNGTDKFPGKKIISSLEKHGVAFGYNINAYTGYEETVYNLSDVPVDPPGLTDTCLMILYDWSDFISLTPGEIDAERGVIIEEWRTRRDAMFRMMQKYLPVILKGSKYEVRDIIGELDVIRSFTPDEIRNFYRKWYRPDLQAVAVVGDFDASEMEKKVIALFSNLIKVDSPVPRPVFTVPFHNEMLYVLATDREAPQNIISIYIKHDAPAADAKNLSYMRREIMRRLMNNMLSVRINELLQKGEPPFITGSISYSDLVRGVDALVINAAANPNREDVALKAIYTEAVRAARHGFTNGELERAKANLITSYDNYYKQKDKISNDEYLNDIQSHFLDGEPLVSVDFEYQFARSVIPGISAEEISVFFKNHFRMENSVTVILGQEADGINHLSENEVRSIIEEVNKSEIAPYQDAFTGESLIEGELKGSPVVKTLQIKQFDAVEWTLGNGARVVYRKADFEKDNVIMTANSAGGTSLYDIEYLPSATMLSSVISMYGLGDFDNITLQKMLAGKKATASVSLGQITEGINGTSTPKDFETMMQLVYLRFAKPRFDREAHDAIMARYAAFVSGMINDPSKIMQDSVSIFLSDYSPRTIVLNNEMLRKVDFGMIEKIYRERFANAADFVFFIVGNVEEKEAMALAEKYIGSLPSSPARETFLDRNVRPPKGRFVKDISIPLTVPKATVFISHSSGLKYTPFNNVTLKVINGILDIVFTEKVREEAGGTYGVSVSLTSQKYPWQNAQGLIMFDCDPDKVEALKKIVYGEIEKLIKSGPSEENLNKSVSNMLKTREEAKQHNNYWSNALYSYYFNGINVDDPANFDNILRKLTVKDIRKVAGQFFGKADVADIVFRPK